MGLGGNVELSFSKSPMHPSDTEPGRPKSGNLHINTPALAPFPSRSHLSALLPVTPGITSQIVPKSLSWGLLLGTQPKTLGSLCPGL